MSSSKRIIYNNSKSRKVVPKKIDPLNKKIPENPRYAHIKHTVDSGASVSRYLRHLEEMKQNYRYRKDEIFKRLKATTFAQLILQLEMYEEEEDSLTPQPPTQSPPKEHPSETFTPPDSARSTLSSVISGIGEIDMKEEVLSSRIPPVYHMPVPPPPYLLLDVRDKEDYEQSHIITAKHYPAAMLSRSCNYFTRDILDYKNKPGRIIIVYDEDERIAPQVATTFIQREVDNVFMLSGGMKVLHKYFPDCMITGQVPPSCLPSPSSTKKKPTRSQSKDHTIPIPSLVNITEHRKNFTEEDLDKIQNCLDTTLSGSTGESRACSRSTLTSSSSQRSVASSQRSVASSQGSNTSRTPSTLWKY